MAAQAVATAAPPRSELPRRRSLRSPPELRPVLERWAAEQLLGARSIEQGEREEAGEDGDLCSSPIGASCAPGSPTLIVT